MVGSTCNELVICEALCERDRLTSTWKNDEERLSLSLSATYERRKQLIFNDQIIRHNTSRLTFKALLVLQQELSVTRA